MSTFAVLVMVLNVSSAADSAAPSTKHDQNKGYVVFPYTIMENLPPSYAPSRRGVTEKVTCTLARSEYESVQFGVHALSDLQDIQVKVESDLSATVYHRISPRIKEQLASAPPEMGEIREWVPSNIHLQRGKVFEALPSGQSVNFWVTLHAGIKTREGVHRGKIRLKPLGKQESVLDLEVTVRPFELQRPRVPFGVYFREDMLPKRFGGRSAPKEALLAMYRDIAEHGHNSNWFFPGGDFSQLPPRNSHALENQIPLAQQAGLLDPQVPSFICSGIPADLDHAQLNAAVAWLQDECRKRGWPELIAFGKDEPVYPRDDDEVRKSLTRLRDVPIRVNLDLSGTSKVYGYGGDLCDVQTVMDGTITPEMLAESKRAGTEIWTYSFRIWREGFLPFRQRFFAGLYTWAHQLGGNWMWAYHHGHHRHAWFAPDSHEPMPLTAWELRREGIDDYRYMQMLEDSVAANPHQTLAIEAAAWLQALRVRVSGSIPNKVEPDEPLALHEYDEIRARAAHYIGELGPVPNESIARRTIAHSKDEAAPYRGKSIQACISGLASSDVSERRAAAWALFELGAKAAPATEALARALDDPDVRIPALHGLELIGPDAYRAVPKITQLLKHPDAYVRLGAVFALGEIGCTLDKRNRSGRRWPSRWAAIVAEPLRVAYRDENPSVSFFAAGMLSVMGHLAKPVVPEAIAMLEDTSSKRRSSALGLIVGLGPHAAAAVPKLIEMNEKKPWDTRHINAVAAIGPAASAAIPALEGYLATDEPNPDQAASYYALFCIRGNDGDLRKMVDLLKDAQINDNTKKHVVKFLIQLGAKAEPVAADVRQMLQSGAYSDWEDKLRSFLEHVKKGEVPGSPYEY